MTRNYIFMALLAGIALSQQANAQQMREGKWEITSKAEMSGMPMQMPAQKVTICVDAKNKDKPPIGADNSCKFSNQKTSGNTMTWKMECTGQAKMTGEGSMSFSGDSYTGSSTMNMDMGGGEIMKMKNSYSGKRLGNC